MFPRQVYHERSFNKYSNEGKNDNNARIFCQELMKQKIKLDTNAN